MFQLMLQNSPQAMRGLEERPTSQGLGMQNIVHSKHLHEKILRRKHQEIESRLLFTMGERVAVTYAMLGKRFVYIFCTLTVHKKCLSHAVSTCEVG